MKHVEMPGFVASSGPIWAACVRNWTDIFQDLTTNLRAVAKNWPRKI